MHDSTNDISHALRERLKDQGSWRVSNGKLPRRWNPEPVDLVSPKPFSRTRVLLGGAVLLLLVGGAGAVLAASTSSPTGSSQVFDVPIVNPVPTADLPQLWLTPSATSDAQYAIDPRPTPDPSNALTAVDRLPTAIPVLHLTNPMAPVAPLVGGAPVPPVARAPGGTVTQTTEHVGSLTVDAQLARPAAVDVDQQLDISARSDNAPLVGAHVSLRVTNSFGTAVLDAPDTDQYGKSSKTWPTYRSVGLNQVRVLVSLVDGRELSAQLAFMGASSES